MNAWQCSQALFKTFSYVNEKRIAEEYLRRCKSGSWKHSNTEDALKCWNLERILISELMHLPQPEALHYTEFFLETTLMKS